MELNIPGILLATVAQFIVGFIWYGPIFGNIWGKIHGFDKLSKATQQKMMKAMGPYYAMQFVVTAVTSLVLQVIMMNLPNWNVFALALVLWFGFCFPVQVSGVIFGGTEAKWIASKIAIQVGGSLAFLMTAAFVLSFFI